MPVCFVNASRVGRDLVLSLTSMYSVQFDQLMIFSLSDMSVAAAAVFFAAPVPAAPDVGFLPAEPQAARKAAALTPAAPIMADHRDTRPRISAARRCGFSVLKLLSFMSLTPGVLSVGRWGGGLDGDPVVLVGSARGHESM